MGASAQNLARALGGKASGNKVLVPGPGHSAGDRSLSVEFDPTAPDGFVCHSFAGDDPLACRDYVRVALGMPAFDGRQREVLPKPKPAPAVDKSDTIAPALAIWHEAVDAAGTLAEQYQVSRGSTLEGAADIGFHGALLLDGQTVPGMVALMRDVRTNEPCGIHRTFLDAKGRKLDRRMLGRAKGACVKLVADAEVTTGLGIAEGIETALSVMQAGWRPVWACLSANAIAALPVLDGIECLTVFADHDDNGAGERAARECCERWAAAGRAVVAIQPTFTGDWNDVRGVAA